MIPEKPRICFSLMCTYINLAMAVLLRLLGLQREMSNYEQ
jgi:hypothetical protein